MQSNTAGIEMWFGEFIFVLRIKPNFNLSIIRTKRDLSVFGILEPKSGKSLLKTLRPNPHRVRDATRNSTQANGTC